MTNKQLGKQIDDFGSPHKRGDAQKGLKINSKKHKDIPTLSEILEDLLPYMDVPAWLTWGAQHGDHGESATDKQCVEEAFWDDDKAADDIPREVYFLEAFKLYCYLLSGKCFTFTPVGSLEEFDPRHVRSSEYQIVNLYCSYLRKMTTDELKIHGISLDGLRELQSILLKGEDEANKIFSFVNLYREIVSYENKSVGSSSKKVIDAFIDFSKKNISLPPLYVIKLAYILQYKENKGGKFNHQIDLYRAKYGGIIFGLIAAEIEKNIFIDFEKIKIQIFGKNKEDNNRTIEYIPYISDRGEYTYNDYIMAYILGLFEPRHKKSKTVDEEIKSKMQGIKYDIYTGPNNVYRREIIQVGNKFYNKIYEDYKKKAFEWMKAVIDRTPEMEREQIVLPLPTRKNAKSWLTVEQMLPAFVREQSKLTLRELKKCWEDERLPLDEAGYR